MSFVVATTMCMWASPSVSTSSRRKCQPTLILAQVMLPGNPLYVTDFTYRADFDDSTFILWDARGHPSRTDAAAREGSAGHLAMRPESS